MFGRAELLEHDHVVELLLKVKVFGGRFILKKG
jgi:hypothetical protein